MPNPQPEAVARHYDSPESQLAAIIFNGHMHLGYWDEASEGGTYAEASARLTRIMIDMVRIERGQRFCDLGCGVGVPAIQLAATKGCHVEGLTVSRFQQQDATARAEAAGMGDKARFTVGDVLDAPFAAESFDGGWFFESIFHIGHREALASARRILKPGATLIIADLTLLPSAAAEFPAYARRNIFSEFIPLQKYPGLLSASGFELLDVTDVSEHVMPQLVPKITETIDLHRQKILDLVGKDVIDGTIASFREMSDNLQYVLVRAARK